MNKIVLIDAYAHIFRMYYAMSRSGSFTNASGEPVGALYGMARLLLQIENTLPSSHGAIAFDKGKAVKRCGLLPEYKANRAPMPDDLRSQIAPIQEWMEVFGWPIIMEEGREADDLIAAVTARREGLPVDILAYDKDITQLVSDGVRLLAPGKGSAWLETCHEQVVEKFGVPPEHVAAYLALIGDTSDNIKGVDGIGPKTAAKLLCQFNGLDGLQEHLAEVTPPRIQEKIKDAGELLERNMKLVVLDTTEPQGWKGLDGIRRQAPDWLKIKSLAEGQNFKSLLPSIEKMVKNSQQPMLF